jgi:hypothetical protein
MQIPILIEPIEGGRFRARAGEPFVLSADADTALEAARFLEQQLGDRMRAGAQIAFVHIPNGTPAFGSPPPLPADDLYKTDWVFRELQEAIAENRRIEESTGS